MRNLVIIVLLLALSGCAAVPTWDRAPAQHHRVDVPTATSGTTFVGTKAVTAKPLSAGKAGVPVLTGRDRKPVTRGR